MSIYFIRNTRSFLLSVSVFALCSQFDGFTPNAYALEPSGPDEIDGLVEGQTTYGPNGYWKPYVEADGFIWDKAAYNGNLRLWSPLIQNPDWILHTTIGGGFFETDGLQGTAGIGFRHVIGDAILGVYGFADVTFTEHGNTFWRVSPGIELLGLNYETRINGYIPIGEDQYLIDSSIVVSGGGAMSGQLEYETNFYGIDGELGLRLPFEIGEEKLHDFWLYGGANYYDHEDADELFGADARFEWRINKLTEEYPGSRLSFIANASWNNVDDFDYGGGIRARLPLGKKARCFNRYPDDRTIDCPTRNGRMDAAVIRRTRGDSVIVQNEIVYDPQTDVDMLTVVTAGDLDGSLVLGNPPALGSPVGYNTLNDAVLATDEVLIVVDGDETPPTGFPPTIVDSNTTVLGTGTTIELRGRTTNDVYNYLVAGARPQFDHNNNGPALTLDGTGIHIAGLGLSGDRAAAANTFNHGIFIRPNAGNIAIEQNIFTDLAGSGISSVGPANDIRIFNNDFSDIGGDAISIFDDNLFVVIDQNNISDIGGSGVHFDNANLNAEVTDNVISDVGGSGIMFENRNDNAVVTGNDITNTGEAGIEFLDNNRFAYVFDNDIIDVGGRGIDFGDHNDRSQVIQNRINGTGLIDVASGEGIRFNSSNEFTVVNGNDVFNTRVGVYYGDENIEFDIFNNNIFGSTGSGIRVGNQNNMIDIDNNYVVDVAPNGIVIGSSNGPSVGSGVDNFITNNVIQNSVNFIDPLNPVNVSTGIENGIVIINNNIGWEIASNEILGVEDTGISLNGQNENVDLFDNVIDGRDWASGTVVNNTTITSEGILLIGGSNTQIRIGGPGIPSTGNPFGYSNRILNVTGYAIDIRGTNNANPNDDIEIDNNFIFNDTPTASAGGIRLRYASEQVEITNNIIENAGIGIQVVGANATSTLAQIADRPNTNVTIQDNQITNSLRNGILVGSYNTDIRIIDNLINGVRGTTNNVGDAIQVGASNTIAEISENVIVGAIRDDILQFGISNSFLFPVNNINNDASAATFIAGGTSLDCSAAVVAGNQVSLISVPLGPNLGATIDCP